MAMMQHNDKRQVVITGMGPVSPIGTGNKNFCKALHEGRSGIDFITLFDASHLSTRFAGEVDDFAPDNLLKGTDVIKRTRERRILLASAAAHLAVDDAGLARDALSHEKSAVIMGAGVHSLIPDMQKIMNSGIYTDLFDDPDPDPRKFAETIEQDGENSWYPVCNRVNGGTLAIAHEYKICGPCHTVVSACAAAAQAIGHAYQLIQRGSADIAVSGGYDSMVFPFGLYAFCLLGLMSTQNETPEQAMKPFDKNRDGFALGEGAGALILEEKTHALKRDARIYATLAGYGCSVDAYKVTDPHPKGAGVIIAMQEALHDARIKPEQIEYINAHGTATAKNDRIETAAIKKVFGKHACNVAVSSTKSMIGHLMAAGGALELIATILGMQNGFIPPTINYKTPDPACDLDYVPNTAREAAVYTALSNSFGLGGQNASLIVTRKN